MAFFFLGSAIGGGIIQLMCDWQGISINEVLEEFGSGSSASERYFIKGLLILNHLSSFLIPCLLAAYLFYNEHWPDSLLLRTAPTIKTLGLTIVLLLCAFTIAQGLFEFNRWLLGQFGFNEKLLELEEAMENLNVGLLKMESGWELLTSLLAMALVPAIGEELFFRGFIQKQLMRTLTHPISGILVASLFFSTIHFQAQRFLAIFWLGIVLGLLYYWTHNLWVSIFAHFLNNGMQVLAAWYFQDNVEAINEQNENFPWYLALAGLLLFPIFSKLLLIHSDEKNGS